MGDVPQYRLYKWVPNWGLPSISVACIQVEVSHVFLYERHSLYGRVLCCAISVGILAPRYPVQSKLQITGFRRICGLAEYQPQQKIVQIPVLPLQVIILHRTYS